MQTRLYVLIDSLTYQLDYIICCYWSRIFLSEPDLLLEPDMPSESEEKDTIRQLLDESKLKENLSVQMKLLCKEKKKE